VRARGASHRVIACDRTVRGTPALRGAPPRIILNSVATGRRSLADLRVGEEGRVAEVGGDPGVARRLMEMGLLPGTRVRIARLAPLGDPIEIRLRSYSLSIRRVEAQSIALTADEE
jgi:ferrous iron transport protein A